LRLFTPDLKKIVTYALALDKDLYTRLLNEFPNNKTIVVANLDSFYNFQLNKNNELCTTFLSDKNVLQKVKINEESEKENAEEHIYDEVIYENKKLKWADFADKVNRIKYSLKSDESFQALTKKH
jgi:hypothetical protein